MTRVRKSQRRAYMLVSPREDLVKDSAANFCQAVEDAAAAYEIGTAFFISRAGTYAALVTLDVVDAAKTDAEYDKCGDRVNVNNFAF